MNTFRDFLRKLTKPVKVLLIVVTDFTLIASAWFAIKNLLGPFKLFVLNFGSTSGEFIEQGSFLAFLLAYSITLFYLFYSGFYRSRIASYDSKLTLLRSVFGSLIYGSSYSALLYFLDGNNELPFFVYFYIAAINFILLYSILNLVRDIASYILYTKGASKTNLNILIYGAGSAGLQLLNTIKYDKNINIVGLYDDSNNIKGSEISGYRVFGNIDQIRNLKKIYPNLIAYLTIPSLETNKRQRIISKLENLKIAVKTMPGLLELVSDDKKLAEMQDLSLDDILLRESSSNLKFDFSNLSIMITGAGGSIGSEIARQVLKGNPLKIILFDISEFNLYKIHSDINNYIAKTNTNIEIIALLGNVRDKKRLLEVILKHEVDIIYHSAAYKHVPIVEYSENIIEGIRNNIFGTKSICEVASETNVKKVVLISTDKAVRPTNVMGATKRFAEIIAQSFNHEDINTNFCMVRFGNVINSSGSVIPLFSKQIKDGGPVTITHKDVTRFFMTIPEAANLVLQAGELSSGGEVFILNMGEQVKIIDLAKRLIHLFGRNVASDQNKDGIEIKEIGLRPGEKLYEELLITGNENVTSNEKIFISKEKFLNKLELDLKIAKLEECLNKNKIKSAISCLEDSVEGFKRK